MSNKIAVIGMACRYPGARNLDEYWNNLISGKDTITHFTDADLAGFEYNYDLLRDNPDFVKARGILEDIDKFDASFFGMSPREAAGTDPQQRVWLQTAWEALENAGCDPYRYNGAIGVFAGGSFSTYLLNNVLRDPGKMENFIRFRYADSYQILTGNDPSFISTKTAYKFNLKGPAINVQTACSTSLVAVSLACQSLYSYESDICLAGGVRISVPQENGYIYQEGGIPSPDGCCRPFDAHAKGTVPGNGVGVVVLKRLEDAIKDGDVIYAVVRGWALNNDGSNKVSYTAPSIEGQAEAIMMAQAFAEVLPEEISYIEAHGTATPLGDPIEITALTRAFSRKTDKKNYCGIGSVKSNIGHTDAAAGAASFIKACLIAHNKIIPATLNYSSPNPNIDFENSPFYVQKEQKNWDSTKPLIMGVSSFGIGGTNAHVILEEPPVFPKQENITSEWPELVLLSAKSENSLDRRKNDLVEFVKNKPDLSIRDVAYSLRTGRNNMKFRSFKVVSDLDSLVSSECKFTDGKVDDLISKVAFLFPGQGAQYLSMGKSLYNSNKLFRETLDECFAIFNSETGQDLKGIIFSDRGDSSADSRLADTEIAQPALFIIEYALAKLFLHLEIKPSYLIGHSIGEYTAACLAEVFDLETALKIVIMRGRLMQKMPRGRMMAVRAEKKSLDIIKGTLFEVAAENASQACTISFKPEHTISVESILKGKGIQYIELKTSHAFHSSDFDPILKEFSDYVNQFKAGSPKIPFISCLTGNFITEEQATSGDYWARQLRNSVMFRSGISTIMGSDDVAFLEVGPNTHLSSVVKQNESVSNKSAVISSLDKPDDSIELFKVFTAIGNLFKIGINLTCNFLPDNYKPHKISLPTYPFEKTRCWLDFQLTDVNYSPVNATAEQAFNDDTLIDEAAGLETMAPTERVKMKILNIWRSLFGINEISTEDNFFDIGGHSLLALQILTRIKEEFHQSIALNVFLDNPTVSKLSSLLTDETEEGDYKEDIVHLTDLSKLALSDNQRRLWIISNLDKKNPAYNIPFTYLLKGELNEDVFRKSLDVLFQRHHILFSRFFKEDGIPYYMIEPQSVKIEYIDYSGVPVEHRKDTIYSYIGADARRCFDIEVDPLYRLFLLKYDDRCYYFHVNINHLIFDGWSWGVFIRDLNIIYNSLIKNEEPKLKELEVQYYDYANWQNISTSKTSEAALTKFWIDYLKDVPPVLNFPYDKARGNALTGFGQTEYIRLSEQCSEKLKAISKSENSTLFATLLSAFGVLLHKYSGDNDMCIGTPVGNRPHSKLEDVFGMFVNTTAIRVKINNKASFSDLINSVKVSAVEAISHQDLPFEKIVEAVNPSRTFNMNPLFQACLAWQNNLSIPLHLEGLKGERVTIGEGISPFDLTFYLWENGDFIEGEIEFNNGLFKRETILRLKENFLSLIDNLASQINAPIDSVPMISNNERELVIDFNKTITQYPKEKTVAQLFEEVADQYPEKRALVFKNEVLTYKQLNEKSNQLARTLKDIGVTNNTPVAILCGKSLDMVVGLLSILKAGGCYVPIDPDYPVQRMQFIIKDSGSAILLTQSLYKNVDVDGVKIIDINSADSFNTDKSNHKNRGSSADLAYIMYTSGTTGTPKGSMILQKSIVRLVRNTNFIEIKSEDRILLTGAIVFDASTFEIWGALLNGGTLFIVEKETILSAKSLGEELFKNNISILWLTSPLFTQIAELRTDIFARLKYLLVGGDVLSPFHINKVRSENPELRLINGYGPTENTTFSTTFLIDREYVNNIPIGKPISNSTAYIFDKGMNYQPIGVIGDLYVGGDGLTAGYLNREDLNKSCFIENPYNPGERLYRTGDRAKWLPDGNIEFHGRVDNQLKIRGFRVELEEVESAISEVEGVVEVVVKPIIIENDLRLVAFLKLSERNFFDTKEITNQLKTKLPSYMVPTIIKVLEELPKNVNGKIDRSKLVFDAKELNVSTSSEEGKMTPTEKVIFDIWKEALKISEISVNDNFFDIGGNSLLAISVFSKIESAFGIDIGLRLFFDSPRIKDLSEVIDINIGEKYVPVSKPSDSQIISGEI